MACNCCSALCNFCETYGLKKLLFLLVLVGYSFIGGAIFSAIEKPNEIQVKREQKEQLENLTQALVDNITALYDSTNFTNSIIVESLVNEFSQRIRQGKYYSNEDYNKTAWDFWNAMFFAGTLYTTIGYGHIAPSTFYGRLATMGYAIVGIPLLLATIGDIGRSLTRVLKKFWTFLHRTYRAGKKISRKPLTMIKVLDREASDNRETTPVLAWEEDNEEFNFPIPLAILMIVLWLFFCSALFCIWETRWDYFTAVYFFFVSLSTIGLGDVTPDHPKFMILNFPLVIIGLSLVTLVINLLQAKVEELKDKTADMLEHQLHFGEYSELDQPKRPAAQRQISASLGIFQVWKKPASKPITANGSEKAQELSPVYVETAQLQAQEAVSLHEFYTPPVESRWTHKPTEV